MNDSQRQSLLREFFQIADQSGYPDIARFSLVQAVFGPVANYETISELAIRNLTDYVRLANLVVEATKRGQRDNVLLADILPKYGHVPETGRPMSRTAIKNDLKTQVVMATSNGLGLTEYLTQLKQTKR